MHCPACGKALARRMKYCNHCGEPLRLEEASASEAAEARFDDYLDGLFWTTVIGLGLILGGMVVMKQVFSSSGLVIAYMILSSTAFLSVFGIHLWQIIRMSRRNRSNEIAEGEQFDTNRLGGAKPQARLEEAGSVTEETTRTFESQPKEPVPRS
jgi:hypothetical protein